MLYAIGLALAGNDARALCYGNTIVAVLISVWAFVVLRRRMEPGPYFLACISLVLLATSPFPLGESPNFTSFAETFNRYGFALESLVLLECFLPSSKKDSFQKQFGGGCSTGLACAVMLFVKISYGMVGMVLAGASVVLRPRGERGRWLGLIAGFTIFALPILSYLRFDVSGIVREYGILALAQSGNITAGSILVSMWQSRLELMLVLLLTVLVGSFAVRGIGRQTALAAAGLMAAVSGTLLLMTNSQKSDLPLMAAVALLLVNEVTCLIRAKPDTGGGSIDPLAALTFLSFGLLAVGAPLLTNTAGFTYALADKIIHRHASYRFQAAHLQALEFAESTSSPYENGELFVRYTEEAMDLVKSNSGSNESVRAMTNISPFSYALLRTPPRGGAVDINPSNFSEKAMPPPEFVLGDVDLILVPAGDLGQMIEYNNPTIKFMLLKYRAALESRYLLKAQSPHWRLLEKRDLPLAGDRAWAR
jgi:hypothetical protein